MKVSLNTGGTLIHRQAGETLSGARGACLIFIHVVVIDAAETAGDVGRGTIITSVYALDALVDHHREAL